MYPKEHRTHLLRPGPSPWRASQRLLLLTGSSVDQPLRELRWEFLAHSRPNRGTVQFVKTGASAQAAPGLL